jgi:hypothetical protein
MPDWRQMRKFVGFGCSALTGIDLQVNAGFAKI